MEPAKLSDVGQKLFKLIEFDDEEKLIYEIRKHSLGLILIYMTGIFVGIALALVFFGLSLFMNDDPLQTGIEAGSMHIPLLLICSLLLMLALLATFIGVYIYKSNVVIVTSDKLSQVLYRTLFDRKISQLSIGDVQDVTVSQVGILARIFDYGTLVVETAGEQQNYTFTYVPRPYEASTAIVRAHEENLKRYGN